jgi:arginase family enzyme
MHERAFVLSPGHSEASWTWWENSNRRDWSLAPVSVSWNRMERFLWSCDDDAAGIAIFGVPLDETTSFRPGTRFGPSAAREGSQPLELYSLRQRESLDPADYVDLGDLTLPMGSVTHALDVIRTASRHILGRGKKFMAVGRRALALASAYPIMLEVTRPPCHPV